MASDPPIEGQPPGAAHHSVDKVPGADEHDAAQTPGTPGQDAGSNGSGQQLDGSPPFGTTVLAGAIAAAVLTPVGWLVVLAAGIEPDRLAAIVFRPETAEILSNTLVLIAIVTAGSVLLGVPLAICTVCTDLPYARFWLVALSLPLVIPSYTSAFAFLSVWGPYGLVQSLVSPFGVSSLPELYGLWGTAFVLTLYNYPFVFVTTVAGLRAFDASYLEAARTLERSRLRAFCRTVLPLIKPAVLAGALLAALETAGDFGVPALLRFDVFTRQIYLEHNALAPDYAAALSVKLVAITLVILALESRVRDGRAVHGSVRGESRTVSIPLGRLKPLALAACSVVVLLSVVLPVAFLLWWLVSGPDSYVVGLEFRATYAWYSAGISVLAAVIAVVLAVPIAYLSARYDSVLTGAFERATYVGFAVPGIVVGLSLVSFGSAHLPALYQTVPLVAFAYVVLYLPLAVGAARATFLYVNPGLVEAARTLGCSPLDAFRRVTLPLVIPGVIAGGSLVFLHGMKELPATLLLRPADVETLATFIWLAERNAYYAYAAVPALVLVCLSGLAIVGMLPREDANYWRLFRRLRWWRQTASEDPETPKPDPAGNVQKRAERATADEESVWSRRTVDGPRPDRRGPPGASPDGGTEQPPPVAELSAVSKRFDGDVAVDDFSLRVHGGEVLTLVGPSGCGKTTTLRLLAGLERPDAGTVFLHGQPVADAGSFVPPEARDVGIIFQEFALFPHRTVGENVAFGLTATDLDETARSRAVADALSLVGLSAYRDRYPDALSGGQAQRVALARSLAPEPDVLLLDEPLSNLDAGLRAEMRTAIRAIIDAVDVTAVWVTHDQAEALSVADRTAVIADGRVEQVGTPQTVFTRPVSRTVADFLGRARYLTGRVTKTGIETPLGTLAHEQVWWHGSRPEGESPVDRSQQAGGPSLPERLDVLVRPDDLRIDPQSGTGDGRVVDRQFTGSTVSYLIELDGGDVVSVRESHEVWVDVEERVSVDVVATHDLPAFDTTEPR